MFNVKCTLVVPRSKPSDFLDNKLDDQTGYILTFRLEKSAYPGVLDDGKILFMDNDNLQEYRQSLTFKTCYFTYFSNWNFVLDSASNDDT